MQIKTYKRQEIRQPHFFILNKGNNCGKPLTAACANCFVCLCNSNEEKQFYYWLCFALWQTSQFEPYLVGSVIPFIHIRNVKTIINDATAKVNTNIKQYQKVLDLLMEINKREKLLQSQFDIIKRSKRVLLSSILK